MKLLLLLVCFPISFCWYISPINLNANIEELGTINLPHIKLSLTKNCNVNCSKDITLKKFDELNSQWGISFSGINKAWETGYIGNSSVSVCVIDTGLNSNYTLKGGSFLNGTFSNDFTDYSGHGTFVSSVIATVAKNVTLIPCKFMDSTGSGMLSDMLSCMNYCAENNVNVINCSFGTMTFSETFDIALQSLTEINILTVAAAGNFGRNTDLYPVYPSSISRFNKCVVSVGGITENGTKVLGSDYGNETVQLGAPGENVLGTGPFGTVVPVTGTSVAAPFVSGAAVLMVSSINLKRSCEDIRKTLIETADPGEYFPSISVLYAVELFKGNKK